MSILQELAKCELLGLVYKSQIYTNAFELVRSYFEKLEPQDYKERYRKFGEQLHQIGESMFF